jgi:hypothetical protein
MIQVGFPVGLDPRISLSLNVSTAMSESCLERDWSSKFIGVLASGLRLTCSEMGGPLLKSGRADNEGNLIFLCLYLSEFLLASALAFAETVRVQSKQ